MDRGRADQSRSRPAAAVSGGLGDQLADGGCPVSRDAGLSPRAVEYFQRIPEVSRRSAGNDYGRGPVASRSDSPESFKSASSSSRSSPIQRFEMSAPSTDA